jgi:hypothetical protein
MAPQTDSIQDFHTYADITERGILCKDMLQYILVLYNKGLLEKETATAWVANVFYQWTQLPEAPSRVGMSKDLAEMEKVRAKMETALAAMTSAQDQLKARQEMESFESGSVISQDAET